MTTFDWCRHCGNHGPMTEGHLPPRVAGNKSPITVYNEQDGALTVLRSFEGRPHCSVALLDLGWSQVPLGLVRGGRHAQVGGEA